MLRAPKLTHLRNVLGLTSKRPSTEVLQAGAQIYLNFLSLTKTSAIDPRNSAERYLTFRDIRSRPGYEGAVPTRDISVIWAADQLRPSQVRPTN
jgi:hypothetical protein